MDNNTEKIILVLYFLKNGSFASHICTSANYKNAIEHNVCRDMRSELSSIIENVLAKDSYGCFDIDNAKVFVAPSNICQLHTSQYPLVVIRGEKIIDVDEWWYTPFKNVLCKNYSTEHSWNIKEFQADNKDETLYSLESGAWVRCTNKNDETDVLFAIKTNNIGFNLD